MSKMPTDIVLIDQAASLGEIQNAMLMMMRELYERMDEQSDPAPHMQMQRLGVMVCLGWHAPLEMFGII